MKRENQIWMAITAEFTARGLPDAQGVIDGVNLRLSQMGLADDDRSRLIDLLKEAGEELGDAIHEGAGNVGGRWELVERINEATK